MTVAENIFWHFILAIKISAEVRIEVVYYYSVINIKNKNPQTDIIANKLKVTVMEVIRLWILIPYLFEHNGHNLEVWVLVDMGQCQFPTEYPQVERP